MIFQHYRELVTADAAWKWFGIQPAKRKGKVIQMPKAPCRAPKAEVENVISIPKLAAA
jgi:hypothetical protein